MRVPVFPRTLARTIRRSVRIFSAVLFCATALVFSLPARVVASQPTQNLVAVGDEQFRVTSKDVQDVKKFFEDNTPFRTTEQEYGRYTIRVFLFAREAQKMGLQLPDSFKPLSPVHAVIALADLYARKALDDYRLDPAVVESYYRAYPERFRSKMVEKKQDRSKDGSDLEPLGKVRADVERMLKEKAKKRLTDEIFRKLIDQYHVQIKE